MSEKSEKKPTEIPVTQKESKDVLDTIFDVCINAIDESTRVQAQYAQVITNIQQEFNDAIKKSSEAWLNISKTMTHNAWGSIKMPAIFTKSINDTFDVTTKNASINNKAIISALELTRQNMRVFNDNIDSFAKLGVNFANTWSSILTPPRG